MNFKCLLTYFRGTNEFQIKVSPIHYAPFTVALNDNLQDARDKDCHDVKFEIFTLDSPIAVKYIEFHILSYFGSFSGGLQYFGFMGVAGGMIIFYKSNLQQEWPSDFP